MKIYPVNDFILLETHNIPKQEGKILLPNVPQDTQLYRVIRSVDSLKEGELLYLKCHPKTITQGDNKYYIAELTDIMATVIL